MSSHLWELADYAKVKGNYGKRYWAVFRQAGTGITKYSHRSFKTATFALNYGRGVLARYAGMKAAQGD